MKLLIVVRSLLSCWTVRMTAALVLFAAFGQPLVANAQHPIDIERLTADGQYFDALVAYDKLPQRRGTDESTIAAARSAWGLSLPNRAIQEYDRVLRDEKLNPTDRARIYLSRAIIEYQEARYQTSTLYAERAVSLTNAAGPLRANAWFIWAQALDQMGLQGPAEEKYLKAVAEGEIENKAEMYFMLGRCQSRLGKKDDARQNFEKVPLHSERTPDAIRQLAEIEIETGHYKDAEFWLTKGRNDYPNSFLDSWVDYARMRIAISNDDMEKVGSILEESSKRYGPSDHWFNLLSASAETYRCGAVAMPHIIPRGNN